MIKSFYIENFGSIKDRLNVSFEASKIEDDTSYQNYFKFNNTNILKVMAFYGANASGKSTIIRALAALRELIIPLNPVLPYYPFEFDNKTKNGPISFGIEFSTSNNNDSTVYRYYVSFNKHVILSEKLEKMTSQKPSLLFERFYEQFTNKAIVKLGTSVQNDALLRAIQPAVFPNKTFISMFNSFKIVDFSDVYLFFLQNIINITPEITRFDDVIPNKIMGDEKFKNFLKKLLLTADFNITDIRIEKKQIPFQMPLFTPNTAGIKTEKDTLFFTHKGKEAGGSIEFLKESVGTKKITVLAGHLYEALSKPSILFVDELESSLHPELTSLVVKCFLDETINPHNSQLVFTSHETTLLNLNLLRRDQINFVYKKDEDCSTFIRSLQDFHPRKTENVEKSYLAGRYQTSPEIREQLLEGIFDEQ